MIGSIILKEFFKLIHQHYNLNIVDFELQVDEDFWLNDDIIDQLTSHVTIIANPKIHEFLEVFKTNRIGASFISDEFVPLHLVELIDFSQPNFTKRNRAFCYSDIQFGYLSLKKLIKINPLSSINTSSPDYRTLIDYVATSVVNNNTQNIFHLLEHIENAHEDFGILIHKFAHAFSSLSIYSYIYYQELLQGGKIEPDQRLDYNLPHGATTNFSGAITYEQYFEVFDIINELNHASDLITRFLKLYHILEYLVYRAELVNIEIKARVNRTFIREIHSLTGKGQSDKEFDVFKRNFKEIFEAEIAAGAFDINPISPDEGSFLKNNWGIDNYNYLEGAHVATLIYRIRNSIVHNKESEFHITMTNPDDYAVVINLIKRFLQKIELQALDKISSDADIISYKSPHIELY